MTSTSSVAVHAAALTKTYPGGRGSAPVHALAGLDLDVAPGTVFGLLGPNGAGKSTTVKILTTLSRPDSGSATVAGHDVLRRPDRVRRAIGLVSQRSSSDPMGTARENLVIAARIQGMAKSAARERAAQLLDRFGLAADADRLAKHYSGGMARKLDVAIGLVHQPTVLFLDEPTTGLDPEARAEMWKEIAELSAREQVTVLLTTHYLDEADHLADRLAIVDDGRVVVEGTPEQLKRELHGDRIQVELAEGRHGDDAAQALRGLPGLSEPTVQDALVIARADHAAQSVPTVLSALDDAGIAVAAVTVARPSLDDVYLRYAGRTYQEAS